MSVWLAETLIATTLLMAMVMMVRRPVARWLGAGAAYWLWALPLMRMLLPALPSDVDPSPLHVAVDQAGLAELLAAQPTMAVAEAAPSIPWLEIGLSFWFAGMMLFLLIQAVGYARFRRHMLDGATPIGEEGRIRLVTSPHASGPLAFGVLRPYIVLPADFAIRYDAQEQDMAIAHERAHHERGDLAANMTALLLLAIHWCNPLAWIAYRAYRADQETACDARVLSLYGRDQAHIYGRAILKAAGGRQFAGACHLTRITTLKGRLKMLSNHDLSLQRISWGMAAVAVVTAAGLALTASGSRAAQQMAAITEKVESADFTRLSDLVTKPAAVSVAPVAPVQSVPAVPATPAVKAASERWAPAAPTAPSAPAAPSAPIAPAADMIAPIPPVPPVTVRTVNNRITVTYADGRVETHRIPTEADIARMVPVVDVRDGCEGGKGVTTQRETVDADGRRHIRVRICNAAIDRAAQRSADLASLQAERAARQAELAGARAERAAERSARAASLQADQAEQQADMAEARAERAARTHHMSALNGLRTARGRITRNTSMPAFARAQALRSIDASIAQLDSDQP
ncbi:M56 family metallopeptidase [Sphingobium sp. CR2-8]|uniref:M56 family metallopeptidase n=1 Tax=Sphingobium sp. CR2-8 TaxID=1306534 RepID=UPI002DBD777D|nr:M56 family metallopeptidase [Sphingobium sp. CR2-8]MEC3910237.1 M56 family metallopeptidase [Sphingobium sp. CR2-8]